MKTVLVVDDEPQILRLVRDYLEHSGFSVLAAATGQEALRAARTCSPDLVCWTSGCRASTASTCSANSAGRAACR